MSPAQKNQVDAAVAKVQTAIKARVAAWKVLDEHRRKAQESERAYNTAVTDESNAKLDLTQILEKVTE